MAEAVGNIASIANIPAVELDGIFRQTMVMGLPDTVAHLPTFYWDKVVEFAEHDSADKPWDFQAAPTLDTTPSSQQAICAYEFFAPFGRQGSVPERVGEFNPSTVKVTMLADEFAAVDGFSHMTIGPDLDREWVFRYWHPELGLGALAVYVITCAALDT